MLLFTVYATSKPTDKTEYSDYVDKGEFAIDIDNYENAEDVVQDINTALNRIVNVFDKTIRLVEYRRVSDPDLASTYIHLSREYNESDFIADFNGSHTF